MASFTSLAPSASSLLTKYLNEVFVVTSRKYNPATGAIEIAANYSELGWLLIVVALLGVAVPLAVIVAVQSSPGLSIVTTPKPRNRPGRPALYRCKSWHPEMLMWPTEDILQNALIFAAAGAAVMLAALLGSVLGQSSEGRKAMKVASIGLSVLIVVYVATAVYATWSGPGKDCIYAPRHPSDC